MKCEIPIEEARKKYPKIPERTLKGIYNYVEHRTEPGGFVYAVVSNNLMGAVRKADPVNEKALLEIVGFMFNYVPLGVCGSPEKVKAWIEGKTVKCPHVE